MEVTNELFNNLELLNYLPEIIGLLYLIAGMLLYHTIVNLCVWSYKFFNMFF